MWELRLEKRFIITPGSWSPSEWRHRTTHSNWTKAIRLHRRILNRKPKIMLPLRRRLQSTKFVINRTTIPIWYMWTLILNCYRINIWRSISYWRVNCSKVSIIHSFWVSVWIRLNSSMHVGLVFLKIKFWKVYCSFRFLSIYWNNFLRCCFRLL